MSGQFESNLRKELRGIASSQGYRATVLKLGEMRKKTPQQKYNAFVSIFKTTAPLKARYFISGGRKNPADLLYQANIETMDLSREIAFATAWVIPQVKIINDFLGFSKKVELSIMNSEYATALEDVEGFIKLNGWSLWAAEIYFFLVKAVYGFDKLKEVTEDLTRKSSPRIAGLLFACLLDRNDDNYSVDAFFSKWKEVFSNVKNPALRYYLSYRAVTQLDDGLEEGMANCLSVEVLNSTYDCYETLVDSCVTVVIENLSEASVASARKAAMQLMGAGVEDVRLRKILFLAGDDLAFKVSPVGEVSQQVYNLLMQVPSEIKGKLPYQVNELVSDVSENGPDAEESLGKLLHLGVNLKALKFGGSLINLVFKISEDDVLSPKIDSWINFQNDCFRLEDCAALDPAKAVVYLQSYYDQSVAAGVPSAQAHYLLDMMKGEEFRLPPESLNGAMVLWIGINLVKQQRCAEAEMLIPVLNKLGMHWRRQANKLYVISLVTSGNIELAVNTAASSIMHTKKFSSELTLPLIFKNRKWNEFRGLDPFAVGVVAYCSNIVQGSASALYICRMACRAIYKASKSLSELWAAGDAQQQLMLRFFFKNVWVEENLSLTDIATSQQARLVRLDILQELFSLDPANEKEYAEEIKSLTLHQTLWLGLKHINESRVFVNEPAILRWAEKELALDYDRWKRTEISPPDDTVLKDVITKFFSEQGGEGLKKTQSGEITSEQDILIISVVERLLKKFLLDPADGLNSYLSSRIRHGSLKGTILGPLEEAGLLSAGKTIDELDLHLSTSVSQVSAQKAANYVLSFSGSISTLVDNCNKEVIRIQTPETPNGKIAIHLDRPIAAKVYSESAKVYSLPIFVGFCFETFWSAARVSLDALSNFFLFEFKQKVQSEFDTLIDRIVLLGEGFESLLTVIRSAATATQLQCDAVASWFLPEKELEQRVFTLNETIDIANKATRNVYRLFNARIAKDINESLNVPLTAYGFATLSDCLYIILENAWKHSGLESYGYTINMSFSFDLDSSLLRVQVKNPLSSERLFELKAWGLKQIQKKYEGGPVLELVPVEGGSGIPKLAKISRFADRAICEPLKIDVDQDDQFTVTVHIPLYRRGDAYDAYSQ
jgi:hypothetical protein